MKQLTTKNIIHWTMKEICVLLRKNVYFILKIFYIIWMTIQENVYFICLLISVMILCYQHIFKHNQIICQLVIIDVYYNVKKISIGT